MKPVQSAPLALHMNRETETLRPLPVTPWTTDRCPFFLRPQAFSTWTMNKAKARPQNSYHEQHCGPQTFSISTQDNTEALRPQTFSTGTMNNPEALGPQTFSTGTSRTFSSNHEQHWRCDASDLRPFPLATWITPRLSNIRQFTQTFFYSTANNIKALRPQLIAPWTTLLDLRPIPLAPWTTPRPDAHLNNECQGQTSELRTTPRPWPKTFSSSTKNNTEALGTSTITTSTMIITEVQRTQSFSSDLLQLNKQPKQTINLFQWHHEQHRSH